MSLLKDMLDDRMKMKPRGIQVVKELKKKKKTGEMGVVDHRIVRVG